MRTQGVILAAGRGTRLQERYGALSKPLVPVDGIPMVVRSIRMLYFMGIYDVCIVCNQSNLNGIQVETNHMRTGYISYTVQYNSVYSRNPAVQEIPALADWYTVVHCDLYLHKFNPNLMYKLGCDYPHDTLLIGHADNVSEYGCLMDSGSFVEKPETCDSGNVMLGMYHISRHRLLELKNSGQLDSEYFNSSNMEFFTYYDRWVDMGTPQRVLEAETLLRE